MVNVGPHLFVLSDSGRVFEGLQGSSSWTPLALPDTAFGWVLAADSGALYIGTKGDARLFQYSPGGSIVDMKLPKVGLNKVNGISFFRGKPICSIYQTNSEFWKCFRWNGTQWQEWPGAFGTTPSTTWDPWIVGTEWNGWFYAGSNQSGVWRRRDGDSTWQEVPRPTPLGRTVPSAQPRAFQLWNDSLFVGYEVAAIHRFNPDGSAVSYQNRQIPMDSTLIELPAQLFTVAVANDHLLTSGWYSAIPLLYSRRTRHWKYVSADSWCYRKSGNLVCPGGPATMSLVTVGDTLYALGTNNVMKIPVSELPDE